MQHTDQMEGAPTYVIKANIYSEMVVDIAGGKEAEGVWEHGVEENIWT